MRNTNISHVVSTRKVHKCYRCGKLIAAGEKVTTNNTRKTGRIYICGTCKNEKEQGSYENCITYNELSSSPNIAFGDEGAYMAEMDYKSELQAEYCCDCYVGKFGCPYAY